MELAEVLGRLDAQAAGKTRVMMGPLRALGAKLKADHALALALWDTGRLDARLLATMAMTPDRLTAEDAESMLASVVDVQVVDELTYKVVAEAPCADESCRKWAGAEQPLIGRAGWNLLVAKLLSKRLAAGECADILETIESGCKSAPVEKAESMMRCLVEIGVRFPEHRPRAIDIGTRWGLIDDRPVPKGCTPFYAPDWIAAILKRKKA
ncbi:DNA alkylation repair protein [Paludisphaera mucosa]|uniref:DNA alkylation repair protein n=1 Tax=Paludisphaera mucosa TaxID=3030827 RepID=A0ABT6FIY1_9BACT|nr:DNA alkylation repair protein [Paludisphaera mucosa]MDG3007454.1 DNA alkylation repair protein [Paludisphaera mucosa]